MEKRSKICNLVKSLRMVEPPGPISSLYPSYTRTINCSIFADSYSGVASYDFHRVKVALYQPDAHSKGVISRNSREKPAFWAIFGINLASTFNQWAGADCGGSALILFENQVRSF